MKKYEPITPGYCGICGTQIWVMGKRRWKPNREYTEVSLVLSNDTVARTSLCKTCAGTLTDAKVKHLIGRIKASWDRELAGKVNQKTLDNMRGLKVIGRHHNNREAHKMAKKLKREAHHDKLNKGK